MKVFFQKCKNKPTDIIIIEKTEKTSEKPKNFYDKQFFEEEEELNDKGAVKLLETIVEQHIVTVI